MLGAAVLQVAQCITECISTLPAFEGGYHLWDLRPDTDAQKSGELAMAVQVLITLISIVTKISILLTYLRMYLHSHCTHFAEGIGIFPSRTNKWFCYILAVIEVAYCIANILVVFLQCTPIQATWDPIHYPHHHCLDQGAVYYSMGIWNVITDCQYPYYHCRHVLTRTVLVFLWPVQGLANIQISLRQRVTLIIMFAIGVIACVAGVCRLWYLSILLHSYDQLCMLPLLLGHTQSCSGTDSSLGHGATLMTIVAIETSLGIMCGCLPGCKPLLTALFPRFFESSHNVRSLNKVSSKMNGQSFPFQSLDGAVSKNDHRGSLSLSKSKVGAVESGNRKDRDEISVDSMEWIVTEDGVDGGDAQRILGRSKA